MALLWPWPALGLEGAGGRTVGGCWGWAWCPAAPVWPGRGREALSGGGSLAGQRRGDHSWASSPASGRGARSSSTWACCAPAREEAGGQPWARTVQPASPAWPVRFSVTPASGLGQPQTAAGVLQPARPRVVSTSVLSAGPRCRHSCPWCCPSATVEQPHLPSPGPAEWECPLLWEGPWQGRPPLSALSSGRWGGRAVLSPSQLWSTRWHPSLGPAGGRGQGS